MTPTQQLLDVKLGGNLEAFVRERRAAAASWDSIATDLVIETGTRVTGESLRMWFTEASAS